jgi:toxin ParE1/3/4
MVTIVWTDLALADLKDVHQAISKDSVVYAKKVVERIAERVGQLQHFPLSGRIVPEFGHKDIRELIEGSYRIIYRVENEQIGIARIHHSAMLLKFVE